MSAESLGLIKDGRQFLNKEVCPQVSQTGSSVDNSSLSHSILFGSKVKFVDCVGGIHTIQTLKN